MPTGAGTRAGRAFVEVGMKDKLTGALNKLQRRFKTFGASMARTGAKLTAASVAALMPVAFATRTFAEFADKMSTVRAVTQATVAQWKELSEQAKELGRTTSFMAAQVAGAQVELGRAGFSPKQILAATPAILALARATDTELPRAAEVAAAAMRGFNLAASDTNRIADVLTATANGSAQTLDDLGEAMKMVAPLAVEAGATIEETAAALGVLANNAIKGTMAGTSLARAYKNLSATSAQKTLHDIGVEVLDDNENMRAMSTILSELGEKTRNFGSGKKLNIFETLFGRGQAAALKLAGPGGMFDDLKDKIDDSGGAAKKAAVIMDDNLGGSIRRLLSATEGIQIAIGEALSKPLRLLAKNLTGVSGKITEFIKKNKLLLLAVTGTIAGAGLLGVAMVAAGGFFILAGAAISGLVTAVGFLSSAFVAASGIMASAFVAAGSVIAGAFAIITSPVTLLSVAIALLGVEIAKQTGAWSVALGFVGDKLEFVGGKSDDLGRVFGRLKDRAMSAFGGIKDAIAAGDIALAWKILSLSLQNEWETASIFLSEKTIGIRDAMIDVFVDIEVAWARMVGVMSDAWAKFQNLVNDPKAVGSRANAMLHIQGFFDKDFDVDAAIEESNLITKQNVADGGGFEADQKKREQEREDRIEGIESERGKRKAANQEALQGSKQRLAAARLELEVAIAKASEVPPAEAKKPGAPGSPGKKTGGIDTQAIAKTLTESVGRVLNPISATSKEGFDRILRATQGLQGASPEKDTAENTKKMSEAMVQHGQKLDAIKKNTKNQIQQAKI